MDGAANLRLRSSFEPLRYRGNASLVGQSRQLIAGGRPHHHDLSSAPFGLADQREASPAVEVFQWISGFQCGGPVSRWQATAGLG